MTIKELYEWSLKHNSEDYELLTFDPWEEVAKPVTEDRLESIHEGKKVTVAQGGQLWIASSGVSKSINVCGVERQQN